MQDFRERSEVMKRQVWSMCLFAPQIIEEEDLKELRDLADEVASNFESVAGGFYQFGRLSPQSKFFSPNGRNNKN